MEQTSRALFSMGLIFLIRELECSSPIEVEGEDEVLFCRASFLYTAAARHQMCVLQPYVCPLFLLNEFILAVRVRDLVDTPGTSERDGANGMIGILSARHPG